MTSLITYTNQPITDLIEKYHGFFAFNNEQFAKGAKPGKKYVSRGAGLYHEAGKSKEFDLEYELIVKTAQAQRIKDIGKRQAIDYELLNYECYYTGDTSEAVDVLKGAGITEEEVLTVYKAELSKNDAW